MRAHRRLAVVAQDLGAHAAEGFEGVLVARQAVFLRRGQGELDLPPPAVTEPPDQAGEPAAGGAHAPPAGRTPVHRRPLARGELEGAAGRTGGGAPRAHLVGEARVTARITGLAQALAEWLGGEGMRGQSSRHRACEGIALALPTGLRSPLVLGPGKLGRRQTRLRVPVMARMEGLIVHPAAPPASARRRGWRGAGRW